jgi:hypothetical protein
LFALNLGERLVNAKWRLIDHRYRGGSYGTDAYEGSGSHQCLFSMAPGFVRIRREER